MDWMGLRLERCPGCSSTSIAPAGRRGDGAHVTRCKDCGLGFLDPMPTLEEIRAMYSAYYSRDDGIGYESYGMDPHATPVDYVLRDILKSLGHSKGDAILDVGCAFGSRVAYFRQLGYVASGVDISEEAVNHGRRIWDVDLHAGKFEEFQSEKPFEILTMIDFIEHLPNPETWIKKVRELTRFSSSLIVLTPDFDCYEAYGENWTGYNRSYEHVLFYNRRSLRSLLEANGFTIRGSLGWSALPATVGTAAGRNESPPGTGAVSAVRSRVPAIEGVIRLALRIREKVTYQRPISSSGCANSFLMFASRRE